MKMTFCIDNVNGILHAEVEIEHSKASILFGPNGSGKTRILNIIDEFLKGKIENGISLLVEFTAEDAQNIPFFPVTWHCDLGYLKIERYEWEHLLDSMKSSYGIDTNDLTIRSDIEAVLQESGAYHQMHPFYFSDHVEGIIEVALRKRIACSFEEDESLQERLEELAEEKASDIARKGSKLFKNIYTKEKIKEGLIEEAIEDALKAKLGKIKMIRFEGDSGIEHLSEPLLGCLAHRIEYTETGEGRRTLTSSPCFSKAKLRELDATIADLEEKDPELFGVLLTLSREREELEGTQCYSLPGLRSEIRLDALPSFILLRIEDGIAPIYQRLEEEVRDFEMRFRMFLDEHPNLIVGLDDLSSGEELAKRLREYEEAARGLFLIEVEWYANEFLSNWFPSLYLVIFDAEQPGERIYVQKFDGGLAPGTPPYRLGEASSAEKTWAAIAINEGIDNAFQGRLKELKIALYQDISDRRISPYKEAEGTAPGIEEELGRKPLDNKPDEKVDSDIGSIKSFLESIAEELRIDELNELLLPLEYRPWKRIICIDEPELHLHASSQMLLAAQMQRICNSKQERAAILLATHSPYFLSFNNMIPIRTDASQGTSLVVTRKEGGFDTRDARHTMGWTSGEFLIGLPHLVFVEGPADKAFLEALYGDFLRNWRIGIIALGGTFRLGRLMNPLTDLLNKRMDDLACSFILDRTSEDLQKYFDFKGDWKRKVLTQVESYQKRISKAKKRNPNDEQENELVECIEGLKSIEELEGKNYIDLGFAEESWGWEKIITPAVRRGDFRGINTTKKYTRNIARSIINRIDKISAISLMRLTARGWRISVYVLSQKDILRYLDMSVVGKLYDLETRSVTELRLEKDDIKGALKEILGYVPDEESVRGICLEMAKENPPTDGLILNKSLPWLIDEITEIIEKIAGKQGYIQ